MLKKQSVIIVGLSALLFGPAQAIELDTNLIKNGDFSNELRYWETEHPTRLSDDGVDGTPGLLLTIDRDTEGLRRHRDNKASICIKVGDGDEFFFAANMKYLRIPVKSHAQRVEFIWYQGLHCRNRGQHGRYLEPTPSGGWQRLSRSGVRPPLGAQSVEIRLRQTSVAAKARVDPSNKVESSGSQNADTLDGLPFVAAIWDDIEFIALSKLELTSSLTPNEQRAIESAPALNENYFKDGGYDAKPHKVEFLQNSLWVSNIGHTKDGAIRSSISSDGPSMGRGAFSSCVNVGAHAVFNVGIFYKKDSSSSQNGGGRFRPSWYEGLNCTGRSVAGFADADPVDREGWQELKIEGLQRPPGAMSMSLFAIQTIEGEGEYSAFWDDIYVVGVR